MFTADGNLFAVTRRRYPIRGDAEAHQIVFGRLSALRAQRQIVFVGATLVAVPFDLHAQRGAFFQPFRVGSENRAVLGVEIVAVELKVNFF